MYTYTYTHTYEHTHAYKHLKVGIAAVLLSAVGSAWANTIAMPVESVLLMQLQERYPDFQVRSVKKTPIENVFEMTIRGDIGYVAINPKDMALIGKKDSEVNPYRFFFLGGNLVDLETRQNLTAQAREQAQRVDVKKLPINDAITEKRGSGANVLYVFSDIDCGYCRRLQQTLLQLKDVTIHTFLVPFGANYDTKRMEKTALVWCAPNQVSMLNKAMAGDPMTGIAGCETPILKNLKLAESLYVRGTPTIVFADGTRVVGNQLDVDGFEERFKKIATEKQKNLKEGQR